MATAPTVAATPSIVTQPPLALSEAGIEGVPVATSEGPAVPILGGTLLATSGSRFAVASDPDRDVVFIVDLDEQELRYAVTMRLGDEPGRAAEDDAGRVHVVLRRGGAVAAIDPEKGTVSHRTAVCDAPRGITFSAALGQMVVACRTGRLMTVPTTGEAAAPLAQLDSDLRDVVEVAGTLWVSRFRAAEVLGVDLAGRVVAASRPSTVFPQDLVLNPDGSYPSSPGVFEATMALGLHATTNGSVVMPHQRSNAGKLLGSYYPMRGCSGGIVHSAVSVLDTAGGEFAGHGLLPMGFISDFALSNDGARFAAATIQSGFSRVYHGDFTSHSGLGDCAEGAEEGTLLPGQVSAVAFDDGGELLVQSREPAVLHVVGGASIPLSDVSRQDTGHFVFHMSTRLGVACATCHREGGDDGFAYLFQQFGLRRTQSLAGGILSTAPYHWVGEHADFAAVLSDTFVGRMGGALPSYAQAAAVGAWLDTIPALPAAPVADAAAVERGAQVFQSAQCGTCHGGVAFTDNRTWDVGTGGAFQTPSLVGLASRAPYMHTGCATRVRDRFDAACGGTDHGDVAGLSDADLDALSAYLESL